MFTPELFPYIYHGIMLLLFLALFWIGLHSLPDIAGGKFAQEDMQKRYHVLKVLQELLDATRDLRKFSEKEALESFEFDPKGKAWHYLEFSLFNRSYMYEALYAERAKAFRKRYFYAYLGIYLAPILLAILLVMVWERGTFPLILEPMLQQY